MSTVRHQQDLPRPGGYEPLRYQRNLPTRGPSGAMLFGGIGLVCAFGWYKWAQGQATERELAVERAWSRINLLPFLLAETDRDAYRRSRAQRAREEWAMEGVEGWEVGKSVYHKEGTKRFIPPSVFLG